MFKRRNEQTSLPNDGVVPAPVQMPRFAVVASDEAVAGRAGSSLAQARLMLAEALGASQPVTSTDRFAGRREALAALINAIEQQRAHVVIFGERGIGKTSLVHVFAEVAREARYLVLYGSCGVESRFDETFRAFAARIPLLYHASISPTAEEAEHNLSFETLLADGPVGPREMSELFADVVGTRIILILDEYDRVEAQAFRRDIAELIKNLSDRAARVQLVLTGVAADLDELIGYAPSIRRNVVGLPIGPMGDGEVRQLLRMAEELAGLRFEDEAGAAVARISGGSPYLVRLLANRGANRALDQRRVEVRAADVREGAQAVLEDWRRGLPRHVRMLLDRLDTARHAGLLGAASRAAGSQDGWFDAADVASHGTVDDPAASLDSLSGPGQLFDREAGPAGTRYRFRHPALVTLLGLSDSLDRGMRA